MCETGYPAYVSHLKKYIWERQASSLCITSQKKYKSHITCVQVLVSVLQLPASISHVKKIPEGVHLPQVSFVMWA